MSRTGLESAWTLMSSRTKQRRTGGLTLLLYQRTLHPELFRILATERVNRRAGFSTQMLYTVVSLG